MNPISFTSDVEEQAHWAKVTADLQAGHAKARRREVLTYAALIASAPVAASGWLAWAFKPRREQTVEFIPVREDGTIARVYQLETLPPEAQSDLAVNAIWNYVRLRESYSSGMADYAYRVVSAMSSEPVRRAYQEASHPKNPASPWAVYGSKVTVRADYVSHDDLPLPQGYSGNPPGYAFVFRRTETREAAPPDTKLYRASVRVHRNVPGFSAEQRFEFNAPAVQIWEYPGAYPISAR